MGDISKKLGLRIKELREKRGLTQLKLADALNMEASNLSKIERGVQIPKEESLEKFAEVFDVDIKDLFDYEHFVDRKVLIKKINTLLDNINDDELRRYYKILINL